MPAPRVRKRPEERRAEILDTAAAIALEEGLERITLRAVADRLNVAPGLISHYFPAAEDLVVEAFSAAATAERAQLFAASGMPVERMAQFIVRVEDARSRDMARLWLNARHLSRFRPAIGQALAAQEELDRAQLLEIIEAGVAEGVFPTGDAFAAAVRILIAVDGVGSYVNDEASFEHPSYEHFVTDAAEWALGVEPGLLHAAIARL
ncbi:TetR family transcriptional regulator [Microbacterium mangrovi]|uniref:TetR family transcriptional regulator n=1 Tax=Microbacterium mangrovi TaxID=1348253 RepID=A0A0B2A292_9MICO|nr:TetR family transcriptional regulator [Microbacterium mangrovi]